MRAIFSLITVLLSAAYFVVGIVYFIARTFGNASWGPDSKAFQRLLGVLRSRLMTVATNLVPWDHEMLGLLSLNRTNEKRPGWFNPISSGQITTIYQEPVVAYVVQQMGKDKVIVARTSKQEFVFRKKAKETEIWLNGTPFGLLAGGALLAPGKGSKMLAHIENKDEDTYATLVLYSARSVALNSSERASGPNPRAVTLMQELDPESENIALAIAMARALG